MKKSTIDDLLAKLNPEQRAAATHDDRPLLIIAGAGTGKTATLVHRVAWLIAQGVDPSRILLLTFTRRAAAEMLRRADTLLQRLGCSGTAKVWGGTFHSVAMRLLRLYGKAIGLTPKFTIHDRTDSEDLMDVIRTDLKLAQENKRFPKKSTCMAIYSRCVNARQKLEDVLENSFPWCRDSRHALQVLFDEYIDRKEAMNVLDYDDLLEYWRALLLSEKGDTVRELFDCILVDEYQDTNTLQAEILYNLSPEGKGLTVVGDDAQSIYAFRAATVRNILDFPVHYPNTIIVKLEQNYRSTQPILEATNAVIALARERYEKNLWSDRTIGERPKLVCCEDDADQASYVIRQILEHRESGIDLRRQAVLFRASHHSILLETELARANIPFHKYGGLKFIEAAHVKDLLAFLRLAENPRDIISGMRVLPLLPGIGPAKARRLMDSLIAAEGSFKVWKKWQPPSDTASIWSEFVNLMRRLVRNTDELPSQIGRVRKFYIPLLELKYDNVESRIHDLEQLEIISSRYENRQRLLLEMSLDPPNSTQELAGPPQLDDDFLVLSTIHSAKGLEWDVVYVLHAADGCIPSDMACGDREEIEEERRLFYVALTRAKSWLYVCHPLQYYLPGRGDQYIFSQRTRFLPAHILHHFEQCVTDPTLQIEEETDEPHIINISVGKKLRRTMKDLWHD